MIRVKFAPLAEEEAADAAEWYESRSVGLGADFLAAIGLVVRRMRRFPLSGPAVAAVQSRVPIRRLLLEGFPYSLCYAVFSTHVQVLAIAHTSRKPGYWLSRVSQRPGRRKGK
jgi:plasmid stabilization system protein ParE